MTEDSTRYRVGPGHRGWRLDRFLCMQVPRLSRTEIQRAIRERVRLDRVSRPRPASRLVPGDEIIFRYAEPIEDPEEFRSVQLPILYEDDRWVALNKPAGMVVQPNNRTRRGSLVERMRAEHPSGALLTLGHRLDRETSGVILLAKGRSAAREIHRAFAARRISKHYLAVVEGEMAPDAGVIDFPMAPTREVIMRVVQKIELEESARAVTRFRVRLRRPGFSLVDLQPVTGRKHQLRLHLREIGHPIVGDKLYGPDPSLLRRHLDGALRPRDQERLRTSRQLLHAASLRLEPPLTPAPRVVRAPLPEDIRSFLAAAGR